MPSVPQASGSPLALPRQKHNYVQFCRPGSLWNRYPSLLLQENADKDTLSMNRYGRVPIKLYL